MQWNKEEADTISLRGGMMEWRVNHNADGVVQRDVSAIKVQDVLFLFWGIND